MTDSEMYICRYGTMEEVWDYMRRSKLALWLARADRAKAEKEAWARVESHYTYTIDFVKTELKMGGPWCRHSYEWETIWEQVELRCREMADRYRHE